MPQLQLWEAPVPVDSLNLRNRTRKALCGAGIREVSVLLQRHPREVIQLRGFGRKSWRDLEKALSQAIPGLCPDEAARANLFISVGQETLFHPRAVRGPDSSKSTPADIRHLLVCLDGLRHRPSVAIMTHRLGLDGNGRRPISETMEALGVSRNAVTLADFRVVDWLRRSAGYPTSRLWLQKALAETGGFATREDLESRLDPDFPASPTELVAALMLLERVEGRNASWFVDQGLTVIDHSLQRLRETVERECTAPRYLSEVTAWFVSQTGAALSPEQVSRIVRFWGGSILDRHDRAPVVVAYGAPVSLRAWSAALLLQENGPLPQPTLTALVARYSGAHFNPVSVWSALAYEPRAVKTDRFTWDWLPRLGLNDEDVQGLTNLSFSILASGGPMRTLELRVQLLEATRPVPSAIVLRWLLKRDPRFHVWRDNLAIKSL